MTTDTRSVLDVLRDLTTNLQDLVRRELALARSEAEDKVGQAGNAVMTMIAGGLLGFAALIVLLDALVYGLANHMPAWLAAVIVGVVVAIIGFALLRKGQSDLKTQRLAPQKTMDSVRRDATLVKEHV
jgi:xanthine/uracil permease